MAVRKSEIAASGPLVPAFSDDRSGKPPGLGASEPTIFDNQSVMSTQVVFRAQLDIGSSRGKRFLYQLAVGGVENNLFVRGTSIDWNGDKTGRDLDYIEPNLLGL